MLETFNDLINNSVKEYIPYLDIDDNLIFLEDLSTAVVLEFEPLYSVTLSEDDLNNVKKRLSDFLNFLEEDVYCQFLFKKNKDFGKIKNNHLKLNKTDDLMTDNLFQNRIDKIEREIENNELFNYSYYVIIKKDFEPEVENIKEILTNGNVDEKVKREIEKTMEKMKSLEREVKNYFDKLNININSPKQEKVVKLLSKQVSWKNDFVDSFKTITDFINSDMKINKDNINLGNKYGRFITFKEQRKPEQTYPTIINYLISSKLDFPYDIIININKLNKEKVISELEQKRFWSNKLKINQLTNMVDSKKEEEEKQTDELIRKVSKGRENFFLVEYTILVKGENEKKLEENIKKMLSNIRMLEGAEGYAESFTNFKLYQSTLPGVMNLDSYRNLKLRASFLADLIPVYGPPESSEKPQLLLRNRYNSLTPMNPLSDKADNKNSLLIGKSGAGKSFTMNIIMSSHLGENPIITIVDKGGSYKRFVENMGGEHFEIDIDKDGNPRYNINPFDVPLANKELYWRTIIQSMVREKGETLKNDDLIVIEESIAKILKKKENTPIIEDFVKAIDEQNYEYSELREKRDKLKRHLNRWTRGKYGDFFNNKGTNLNVENDIISIDLKGIEDYERIMEIMMIFISSICWYKAEKWRERKKIFTFDEVWQLFLTEQGKELLQEMFKTMRKYGGSVYAIDQNIETLANSEYSHAILGNIEYYYILQQSEGADLDTLQEELSLSDTVMENIHTMTGEKGFYSDIYIKSPFLNNFARLVPSEYEYWLATTDSSDIIEFEKEYNGNLSKTLDKLAEKYPHGVVNK